MALGALRLHTPSALFSRAFLQGRMEVRSLELLLEGRSLCVPFLQRCLSLIFFQRARSLAAPLARSRKALTLTGSVGDVDPVALSL